MSTLATCPQCAALLALPPFASADDRAECPECGARFLVADAQQRKLPAAKLLPPGEEEIEAEAEPAAEPELAKPESTETELTEPSAHQEMSPALRAAETMAFPSTTLSGWEERLKQAIETNSTKPSEEPQDSSNESTSVSLENAPEFDFHMDPPLENAAENLSPTSPELPDTEDWFEGKNRRPAEEPPAPAAPPVDVKTRKRRAAKPSLVKRASVAVVCGLLGLLVGQYALVWLRGPSADYVQLAQYLPDAIRPSPTPSPPDFVAENPDSGQVSNEGTPLADVPRQTVGIEPRDEEPAAPAEPPPVTHDEAVAPATVEVPRVRLLPATNTTPAEFSELVAGAGEAASVLVSGDLKSLESARAKGHAYIAFCRLAERFDFVNGLGLAPAAQRAATSAQALLRSTAATAAPQNDFAVIITRWWQHLERPNQGIFLVGRVQNVRDVGDHTLYDVAVVHDQESTLIPVLVDQPSYQVGDQIGVVGTIVTKPRAVLTDFTVDVPQLAVAQDSFVVPAS